MKNKKPPRNKPIETIPIVALSIGIVTIPATVALSLRTGPNKISITPVLLGGLLVGYVYDQRPVSVERASVWMGVVGSLPFIWQAYAVLQEVWSSPPELAVLAALFVPVSLLFGLVVSVFSGLVSARIGFLVTRRIKTPTSTMTQ